MADRLSVLDASFLDTEAPSTPLHVGAASSGSGCGRIAALIEEPVEELVSTVPGQ